LAASASGSTSKDAGSKPAPDPLATGLALPIRRAQPIPEAAFKLRRDPWPDNPLPTLVAQAARVFCCARTGLTFFSACGRCRSARCAGARSSRLCRRAGPGKPRAMIRTSLRALLWNSASVFWLLPGHGRWPDPFFRRYNSRVVIGWLGRLRGRVKRPVTLSRSQERCGIEGMRGGAPPCGLSRRDLGPGPVELTPIGSRRRAPRRGGRDR
jgi:hypothetical protein